MENQYYMGLALEQAAQAFDQGEFPVGCVIVQHGRVIAHGARKGTSEGSSFFSEINHAEIRALQELESMEDRFEPEHAVLYCTMEPCLMCFGAIILSGIKKIVYAYEDPMGGGTGCDFRKMAPLYKKSNMEIVSGVFREKSLDLFNKFFNKEANLYWKNSYLETYTREEAVKSGL